MILDSTDKLRGKSKRPDINSIFDFIFKTVATNIDKDTLTDFISQLITGKVIVNKKTPNGYYSLYLSNFDQREIDHTPGTNPTGTPRRIHVDSTWILRRYVKDQISTSFYVISAYFFDVISMVEKSTLFHVLLSV